MLFSAIILSVVMPMQVSMGNPKFEPFIVKATVDAAVLIGLPRDLGPVGEGGNLVIAHQRLDLVVDLLRGRSVLRSRSQQ